VLNRLVAVKLFGREVAKDKALIGRLMTEAQASINLTHAAIARVYECGQDGDDHFVVSEYVRGASLRERISRLAPFNTAVAVEVAVSVAEALEHAHKNGFTHGDLRPENILVVPDGGVKVADFGIGILPDSAEDASVAYLAPEHVKGEKPSQASDLYQLALILYEMLTGAHAFSGGDPTQVAVRRTKEPPASPRSVNEGIPRTLEGIILKALQPDPKMRYGTATEMLEDLRIVRNGLKFGRPLNWSPMDDVAYEDSLAASSEEAKERGPLLRGVYTVVGVVAAAAVVILLVWAYLSLTNPKEVETPNVVGLTVAEASSILSDHGLELGSRLEETSSDIEEGKIIRQQPPAGLKVKEGRKIEVYVSSGPPKVTMPDLGGLSLTTARAKLNQFGLILGQVTREYSDDVKADFVISQYPVAGGQVPRGQEVSLVVSQGSREPEPWDRSPEYLDVSIELSAEPEIQRVRIFVDDATGRTCAVDEVHKGGETFTRTVKVTPPGKIEVYSDDKKIHEDIVGE
jgi:serine/threonine protein kinase